MPESTLPLVAERTSPVEAGGAAPASAPSPPRFAEEQFRLAVEACPSGMIITDAGGRIVLVNGEIEKLFGYRRDELIDCEVDILVPPRLRAQYGRRRNVFAARPERRRLGPGLDLCGLRKDGSEFPVEVGINPIATPGGLLVLSVVTDISERRRMERLKDEFVATVSHELRTPLTSIAGSLGLLIAKAGGQLPESAVRLLTIAHTNSRRLVRLINDILDIQKIESGEMVFKLARVDVRALVEQTIEANRGFAETYGIAVHIDSTSVSADVRADPDRLIQVITNLLSNAIKFSPSGEQVVVATSVRDEVVRISVRDHGPGIPADFHARIFEKFAQADSSDTRQKGGTGLGLSIAKGIVSRLGGVVSFECPGAGGTVFHVDLPVFDPAADVERRRPRVLHVDDDADVLGRVARALSPVAEVLSVETVAEARRELAFSAIDLAVLDIALTPGSGLDLLPDLRDCDGRPIPVVVFTSHGGAVECDDQIQAKVVKSHVSLSHLVATVRDRLGLQPAHPPKEVA